MKNWISIIMVMVTHHIVADDLDFKELGIGYRYQASIGFGVPHGLIGWQSAWIAERNKYFITLGFLQFKLGYEQVFGLSHKHSGGIVVGAGELFMKTDASLIYNYHFSSFSEKGFTAGLALTYAKGGLIEDGFFPNWTLAYKF